MKNLKNYAILALNTLGMFSLISQTAFSQQSIDAYVLDTTKNNFVLVASTANSLSSPVDLDFHPDQTKRPNELWILNQGTNSSGGSTEIVFDANKTNRTYKYVKDGNAWHFMAMASAMAFGNDLWATSADILDANRQTGKYTGPTLWPSDLKVYGIVGNPSTQTENGSHLSMIHQSPYGKGIAFEKDNIYWVLDGYEGNIKRYDFGDPHQPGGEDHSGGGVSVFSEFKFTRHNTLPSHIVIDANKKYLYGCDPIGKRVFRIDVTTGVKGAARTKINGETLSLGYYSYTGLTKIDTLIKGFTSPVGIDIYGNRLIVTDNGTDEIIIYDISKNYSEVGRIKLKYAANPDPMGVKVGPDGKIYFVDKTNKSAYMIENSAVLPLAIKSIDVAENRFQIFPNPATNQITIYTEKVLEKAQISIINALGETVLTQNANQTGNSTFDVATLSNGIYFIVLKSDNIFSSQKFIKQ
jgi:DNA-binding beta-propeller fold protein YncE